jgi:DNA replication protein DnaC
LVDYYTPIQGWLVPPSEAGNETARGVGTGKTHMAIALGIAACEKGLSVRFLTVTELVLKLTEAYKQGTLERLIRDLKQLDLLILDEWGYVPVDREGSQLLFRIIADSYESKSLILTTNLEFSKWGGIFTDEQMAAAMIDRLVHHGHLLLFEAKSYRMTHALMRQPGPGKPKPKTLVEAGSRLEEGGA